MALEGENKVRLLMTFFISENNHTERYKAETNGLLRNDKTYVAYPTEFRKLLKWRIYIEFRHEIFIVGR